MSIVLKNFCFNNLEFVETVKKIYRSELPSSDAYRLFKMLKELNEKASEFSEIKNKILEETAKPDKDNEGSWNFNDKESSEKFQTEFESLLDIEFTLNTDKINYPKTLNISPYEMELMEVLFNYEGLDG